MKNMIFITTKFEGFHKYIDAPEEVKFLRHEHRHLFNVKVYIEVFNNERDIEFILFKRYIENLIKQKNMGGMSCETISDNLHRIISLDYPEREIWIEVNEDNENGSYKEYDKK